MAMKRTAVWAGSALLLLAVLIVCVGSRSTWHPLYVRLRGRRTVGDAVARYGPRAEARLRAHFDRSAVPYPPARIALLAFKRERSLELWSEAGDGWSHVHSYPVLAASGGPGPKLREGDRQVPEGVYGIIGLNPNSSYHLSMKLDYPNTWDRQKAAEEGRTNLGGDIFIHGKAASIGCLAVGDSAIEELFVLVARMGTEEACVIIGPCDLRRSGSPGEPRGNPPWLEELYDSLRRELEVFGGAGSTGP